MYMYELVPRALLSLAYTTSMFFYNSPEESGKTFCTDVDNSFNQS